MWNIITVNGRHTFSHVDLPYTSAFSSANPNASSTNVVRLVIKVTSYSYSYSYSANRYPSVNPSTPSTFRWQLAPRLDQLRSASAPRSKTRITFTELGFSFILSDILTLYVQAPHVSQVLTLYSTVSTPLSSDTSSTLATQGMPLLVTSFTERSFSLQ